MWFLAFHLRVYVRLCRGLHYSVQALSGCRACGVSHVCTFGCAGSPLLCVGALWVQACGRFLHVYVWLCRVSTALCSLFSGCRACGPLGVMRRPLIALASPVVERSL